MTTRLTSDLSCDDTIRSTAATWFIRLREQPSRDQLAAFDAWLRADSRHRQAFQAIAGVWGAFDDNAGDPDMLRYRREAHASIGGHRTRRHRGWHRLRRPALALILLGVVVSALQSLLFDSRTYETGYGERQVVRLEDDTWVTLDERSRLEVDYSPRLRSLALQQGQARFHVTHDGLRPFEVLADGKVVRATGTDFNLDLVTSDMIVTLLEGSAEVMPLDGGLERDAAVGSFPGDVAWPVALQAGEQLVLKPDAVPFLRKNVDIGGITAWERGRVVFSGEPLARAVERLNHFSRVKLVIHDQDVADIEVSGVFDTHDADSFADAVTAYLPVSSHRLSSGEIMLAAGD